MHVVLQPGNYHLDDSIKVNTEGATVLGIGLATLISTTGKPCIEVGNVDGVRIAGVLLQAGETNTPSLLKWGTGTYASSESNPGVMSDVFARVGGPDSQWDHQARADVMVQLNSDHVIIDNTWLWRADHDVTGQVKNGNNPVKSGVEVNGNSVTAYALAAEHTLGNLV